MGGENAAKGGGGGGKGAKVKVKRTALNDTASHVLKGAAVAVLGARAGVTVSVDFTGPSKGVLVLELTEGDKPTDEQIVAICAAANDKIQANVSVLSHAALPAADAEAKFGGGKVNHTHMHLKAAAAAKPLAAGMETLAVAAADTVDVCEIGDWSAAVCDGVHTAQTGELKAVFIMKATYKAKSKQATIAFAVGDVAVDAMKECPSGYRNAAAAVTKKAAAKGGDNKSKSGGSGGGGGGGGKKGKDKGAAADDDAPPIFANFVPGSKSYAHATADATIDATVAALCDGKNLPALVAAVAAADSDEAKTIARAALAAALHHSLGDAVTQSYVNVQNASYARGYGASFAPSVAALNTNRYMK
jgi:Ser-tRNA(Ala) deacylase AlaX